MSPRDRLRRTAARGLAQAYEGLARVFEAVDDVVWRARVVAANVEALARRVDVQAPCALCEAPFPMVSLDERGRCDNCAFAEARRTPCADPACEACGPEIVS